MSVTSKENTLSKTTRELAELFGVSKQAIEKRYTPEFKAKYMSKVTINGVPTWLVSDEGVNLLKSKFQGNNLTTNETPTNDKMVAVLEEQIKSQKNQIDSLQKLLDQSQQLLLSEQKKSQMLIESKTESTPIDWGGEKERLEKQVTLYQMTSREANKTAIENERWAIRTEKAFWLVVILAGIFFVLLLILGWLYLMK